jgi:hypothetical protein
MNSKNNSKTSTKMTSNINQVLKMTTKMSVDIQSIIFKNVEKNWKTKDHKVITNRDALIEFYGDTYDHINPNGDEVVVDMNSNNPTSGLIEKLDEFDIHNILNSKKGQKWFGEWYDGNDETEEYKDCGFACICCAECREITLGDDLDCETELTEYKNGVFLCQELSCKVCYLEDKLEDEQKLSKRAFKRLDKTEKKLKKTQKELQESNDKLDLIKELTKNCD